MKRCSRCGDEKSTDDFFAERASRDGLHSICKECSRIVTREWNANNRDRLRARTRERLYGLDEDGYWALEMLQDRMCAICSKPFGEGRSDRANIDHDHGTGDVRGLLCHSCNLAIGMFGESPELLERAALYLRKGGSWGLIGTAVVVDV